MKPLLCSLHSLWKYSPPTPSSPSYQCNWGAILISWITAVRGKFYCFNLWSRKSFWFEQLWDTFNPQIMLIWALYSWGEHTGSLELYILWNSLNMSIEKMKKFPFEGSLTNILFSRMNLTHLHPLKPFFKTSL